MTPLEISKLYAVLLGIHDGMSGTKISLCSSENIAEDLERVG